MAQDENPSGASFEDDFLKILNNRSKQDSSANSPPRTRGFVVLARGATSLKPLQAACFNQTYNKCLTARYRLQPEAGLGTLLIAFLKDLELISQGSNAFQGDLKSFASADDWKPLTEYYLKRAFDRLGSDLLSASASPAGILNDEVLLTLLGSFEDETHVMRTGERLVLFGEFTEAAKDLNEWFAALSSLFARLPERVGLVLSGAPKDFSLPTNDPHYLEITIPKSGDTGADPNAQTVTKYALTSLLSDLPAQNDKLGFEPYAEAIARFVLHPQTKAPLTFGVYGEWGKGKSSFMKMIDLELIKQAAVNVKTLRPELRGVTRTQRLKDLQVLIDQLEPQVLGGKDPTEGDLSSYKTAQESREILWQTMRKDAKHNVISVTFNAWQFEDSKQIWAGLASQISKRIEEELPWLSQQWLRIKYAWKERRTELLMNMLLPVAVICLVVGLFALGYLRNFILPQKLDFSGDLLRLLLPTGSALLTIWFLSANLLKVAKPMSERVLSYVSLPSYRDQMGFQHRVKDDLSFIFKFLKSRRPDCKVIVYIDDLDRCSETKIMEILQAINLILAGSEFFVFVGMNMEIIERAIEAYYKDKAVDELADYYLSKIVQISFELPKNPDLDRYLSSLFSHQSRYQLGSRQTGNGNPNDPQKPEPKTPGALSYDLGKVLTIVSSTPQEVEDTPDELQAFCDYSHFLDNNPRKVLRLINTHRLIKILLQRDNTFWPVERQRKLVIWRIFCEQWPEMVHYAIASPATGNSLRYALQRWEEVENKSTSPVTHEHALAKVFVEPISPEDALSSNDIDEDFRRAAELMDRVR